jgi:hypothetical protein
MKISIPFSLLALPALLALPLSGSVLLQDNFTVGDGTGDTYTVGNIVGQTGGQGWAPGSQWAVNGADVDAHIQNGDYLSFFKANAGGSNIRGARREVADYGVPLSNLQIQLTIEMANLQGISGLTDTNASPTTNGGNIAADYFSFQNRAVAGNLNFNESNWWVEASAGYWHALGGGGGSANYGTPVQLAPIVEGETYTITMSFSGNDEWAVSIEMIDAQESYDSGWLPFIGNNSDENVSNWIHFRNAFDRDLNESTPFEINLHDISIIPEPATFAALLGALALIGVVVIRRRR